MPPPPPRPYSAPRAFAKTTAAAAAVLGATAKVPAHAANLERGARADAEARHQALPQERRAGQGPPECPPPPIDAQKKIKEELQAEWVMQTRMWDQAASRSTRASNPYPTSAALDPQFDWRSLSGGEQRISTGRAFNGVSCRVLGGHAEREIQRQLEFYKWASREENRNATPEEQRQ